MSYETLLSKLSILNDYVEKVATGLTEPYSGILMEISSLLREFNEGLIDARSGEEEEEVARAVIKLAKATDVFEKFRPGNNK
jgi:hypothetical protein